MSPGKQRERTSASQAADCAEYLRLINLGRNLTHFNGVQAEPLIPIDWDLLIPPWLHLILGTGNEVVKKIYVQLLQLNGVDQARIDNLARLAEERTECEHSAIDTIVDAIGHLGPDDAAVKALGEDKGGTHGAGRVNGAVGATGRRAQCPRRGQSPHGARDTQSPREEVDAGTVGARAHQSGGAGAAV